jgi:hypothetical protein
MHFRGRRGDECSHRGLAGRSAHRVGPPHPEPGFPPDILSYLTRRPAAGSPGTIQPARVLSAAPLPLSVITPHSRLDTLREHVSEQP